MATAEILTTAPPQIKAPKGPFRNEPLTDFSHEDNARKMRTAIEKVRGELGREAYCIILRIAVKNPRLNLACGIVGFEYRLKALLDGLRAVQRGHEKCDPRPTIAVWVAVHENRLRSQRR